MGGTHCYEVNEMGRAASGLRNWGSKEQKYASTQIRRPSLHLEIFERKLTELIISERRRKYGYKEGFYFGCFSSYCSGSSISCCLTSSPERPRHHEKGG